MSFQNHVNKPQVESLSNTHVYAEYIILSQGSEQAKLPI